MRALLRDMRRAPVRIATSIVAIALAIAAIGVFAVPGVAGHSLRSVADDDRLTHVDINTSPIKPAVLTDLEAIDGVESIEGNQVFTVEADDGADLHVVASPPGSVINRLHLDSGRLPAVTGEVVVAPGMSEVGDQLTIADGFVLTVVGVGQTTYWAEADNAVFTLPATGQNLAGRSSMTAAAGGAAIDGVAVNHIMVRMSDPTAQKLDAAVAQIRAIVEQSGATFVSFPVALAGGAHPIEADITQVSFMIGSLGVVAGIVALILLASTTNAVVTERSRDASIMRAMGGTRRVVRRDLRRLAIAIGAFGTLIGLPLGIVVANIIARMVLTRFAGITPGIGFDPLVLSASAAFGLVGARLVSGRVARRVAGTELATSLRDRDAIAFGSRFGDRLATKLATGGLLNRMALRSSVRRRGRAVAVVAQFAAAVGAAVLVACLAASITDFNTAELATYRWQTSTSPVDNLSPYTLGPTGSPGSEVGVRSWGEIDGWELDLIGVDPATTMVDTTVTDGAWLPTTGAAGRADAPPPAVLASKFAHQEAHAVGDVVTVDLASGPAEYTVVGLSPIRSVALFVAAEDLAADLRAPGMGNTVWAMGDATPPTLDGIVTTTTSRHDLFAQDAAARDAILAIFIAIGAIVVAIATLGAASTVAMNLYERRSELATVLAVGGRRNSVFALIGLEVGPLAMIGWAVGVVAGGLGAWAIMGFFETVNAIELGFRMSWVAVPISLGATIALTALLASLAARQSQRRPIAAMLRAAT